MKIKISILLISISLIIMSFNSDSKSKLNTGNYGICEEQNQNLVLAINEDNTFHYINKMNSKKPIDITGDWSIEGNVVVLKNYDSNVSIPNKWKIVGDQMCVKSKGFKNLQTIRICLITN